MASAGASPSGTRVAPTIAIGPGPGSESGYDGAVGGGSAPQPGIAPIPSVVTRTGIANQARRASGMGLKDPPLVSRSRRARRRLGPILTGRYHGIALEGAIRPGGPYSGTRGVT